MLRTRFPVLVVTLSLVAAACTSSPDPAPTTTTTTTAPTTTTTAAPTTTTTLPATTTTQPVETTTTLPLRIVAATGELPPTLLGAVGSLYSVLADERNDTTELPEGLVAHLASLTMDIPDTVAVTAVIAALPDGDSVAVVHRDEDLLFAYEDEGGWHIAGARLSIGPPWLGDEPRLMLVLGSDARVGQNQLRFRADSIHILSAAPNLAAGAIVGFPRDSWVEGPEGLNKFAHHMAGTGPEVMLDIARDLTGLDIEGYVVTGFKGYAALIDILGALVIDLPTRMRTGNNWKNFAAGPQTLNPNRALQLARIRKGLPGGDFARSFNQGLIMQAAMSQVQNMGIDMLPLLLVGLLQNAWTDLDTRDLLTWAATLYFMEPEDLTNIVLSGIVANIRGASVVLLDESADDVFADLSDGILEPAP
ncbi:MAG: LCP family protein [Acidimicrobiia bacterium]